MAAILLPQYRFTVTSSMSEDTGVVVDKTDDGANASRDLYARSYFDFQIEFAMQPVSGHATLMAFLRSNRAEEIDLTLDGVVYRCRITRAPSVKFTGNVYRQVSCSMRGYAL